MKIILFSTSPKGCVSGSLPKLTFKIEVKISKLVFQSFFKAKFELVSQFDVTYQMKVFFIFKSCQLSLNK